MNNATNLYAAINRQLHEGTCPGAGALGECPAIWLGQSGETVGHYYAAVYLWPAAETLPYAEVARWFKVATGCEEVEVNAIMHDEYNDVKEGRCSDGARPLTVQFSLTPEKAEALGLELPQLTPKQAEPVTRMSAAQLLGVRTVAPHITAQQCEEIANLQVDQLQLNLLRSLDLHWKYRHALDGIADIQGLPGSGSDGHRMHKEMRAVVRGLLAGLPEAEPPSDLDGEAFRQAAELGLTLRFYGGCAQSGMPGSPSAYEVVVSSDRAEGMRQAVNLAGITIKQRPAKLTPQTIVFD